MENYNDLLVFLSKKKRITKNELQFIFSLSEDNIKELINDNIITIDDNQYYNINIQKKDVDKKKSSLYLAKEEIKNNNLIEAEKILLKYKNIEKSSSAHYQLFQIYYKQKKYKKAYEELLLAKSLIKNDDFTYNDQIELLKEIISKQKKVSIFNIQFKDYILYLANNNKIDELIAFISISDTNEIFKNYTIKLLNEKNSEIINKIKTYKK